MVDTKGLEKEIEQLLDNFYDRRIDKIKKLKLKDTLLRKNPYLFRAVGVQKAGEIVEGLLTAYMSSSDEGIFGDAFFEPLAKYVSGGSVSPSEGVDVAIETEDVYKAIAVKSGPHVFNAQSRRRQVDDFETLRKRLLKLKKMFDPVIGYAYGRKQQSKSTKAQFRELAGQAFWEEITGDPDFYLKIVRYMKDQPQKHLPAFRTAWDAAVNRFTRDFIAEFCFADGSIDWDKLVHFNSGRQVSRLIVEPRKKTLGPGESQQLIVTSFFADGSSKDVTDDSFVTYLSSDEEAIRIDDHGLVTVSQAAPGGMAVEVVVSYIKSQKVIIKVKEKKQ